MQKLQTYARDVANFISIIVASQARFAYSPVPIDDPKRELIDNLLNSFVPQAKELGLDFSLKRIHRAQRALLYDPEPIVANALDEVCSSIIDELKNIMFLKIESKYIHYYNDKILFGQEIADKMPSAIEDIQEAGKCFALHRFTACVFHLMRIMERGVQELGNQLGLPSIFTYNQDWQKIINAIRGKLNMIYKKHSDPERIKYESILGHLETIKIAWRNPTMHPKANYTELEAKAILDAVGIFLNDLVIIL